MIYVPNLDYQCYVVQSEEVIRAYEQIPTNNSTIEYRDYYFNSNYLYKDGQQTFSNYTTLPVCLASSELTTDFYYRNDLADILMGFALGIAGYVLYTNGTLDNLFAKQKIAPASEAFESVAVEATQPTEEVVAVVEESVVAEIATPTESIAAKSTISPMQKGCSYAVWGVYNELQNAEKAVEWLSTRIPEIEGVSIYDYDGRYMVALCEVTSRSECGRKVSVWKAQHKSCKSVWVYTR